MVKSVQVVPEWNVPQNNEDDISTMSSETQVLQFHPEHEAVWQAAERELDQAEPVDREEGKASATAIGRLTLLALHAHTIKQEESLLGIAAPFPDTPLDVCKAIFEEDTTGKDIAGWSFLYGSWPPFWSRVEQSRHPTSTPDGNGDSGRGTSMPRRRKKPKRSWWLS
jgi:hypothetical protein